MDQRAANQTQESENDVDFHDCSYCLGNKWLDFTYLSILSLYRKNYLDFTFYLRLNEEVFNCILPFTKDLSLFIAQLYDLDNGLADSIAN